MAVYFIKAICFFKFHQRGAACFDNFPVRMQLKADMVDIRRNMKHIILYQRRYTDSRLKFFRIVIILPGRGILPSAQEISGRLPCIVFLHDLPDIAPIRLLIIVYLLYPLHCVLTFPDNLHLPVLLHGQDSIYNAPKLGHGKNEPHGGDSSFLFIFIL